MQLDPRIAALGTANLPCYPSLLKQQLRELVLRRKSLVREEPEDDPTAALAATAAAFAARNNVPGSAFSAAGSSASSSSAGKKRRGHGRGRGPYSLIHSTAGTAPIDIAALAAHLLQVNSNSAAVAAMAAASTSRLLQETATVERVETQRVERYASIPK